MSTVLLSDDRQRTISTRPPDAKGQQLLHIPDLAAQQALPFTTRLTLRIALWLLHRSIEQDAAAATELRDIQRRAIAEREAMAVLSYGLQRRLL